jgi:hypothetical protein
MACIRARKLSNDYWKMSGRICSRYYERCYEPYYEITGRKESLSGSIIAN